MTRRLHIAPALIALSVLATAGAARAADPAPAQAAPVATAPASSPAPAPMSIGEQIDTYLKTSPAAALPKDAASGVTSGDAPRQVHGVVDVAVGSNGYRSAYVASELPLGKSGTATIAVRETQFKGRGGFDGPGYGYDRFGPQTGQSLALGLQFGGAGAPTDWRCRQAADDGGMSLDPRFGGGRACPTRAAPPAP